MPVLTFDVGGPNEMDVECERGGHAAPRKVGARGYPASGSEFSQVRAELMVVPFVLAPLPWTQIATIRSMFALAKRVNCAGDLFNKPGTIVCSGTITDELHTTADRGTVSGTLFEIGSATSYTPATTRFLLTSVDSPDSSDPTVYLSTPDGSYPGDADTSFDLLSGSSVTPSGGSLNPTTPDLSSLSVALNAGIATGILSVQFETSMTGIYSGTTVWATMDVMAKISQVRDDGMGGFDVIAGPFSTGYAGVSPGGGVATISTTSAVVLALQTGDRMLVDFYPRLALQPLASDNSQRQRISFGAVPGPRSNPVLIVGGVITSYP